MGELDEPATLADLVLLMTVVTTQIMTRCGLSADQADEAMERMANELLDAAPNAIDARSRKLLSAFAQQLIATEEGT